MSYYCIRFKISLASFDFYQNLKRQTIVISDDSTNKFAATNCSR